MGYNLYWRGSYGEALRHFEAADTLQPGDARFVYYRGLAERSLGRVTDAAQTVRLAVKLEGRRSESVSRSLERLQGPKRMWLERIRSRKQTGQTAFGVAARRD